jgi:hypothetical protein
MAIKGTFHICLGNLVSGTEKTPLQGFGGISHGILGVPFPTCCRSLILAVSLHRLGATIFVANKIKDTKKRIRSIPSSQINSQFKKWQEKISF